MCLALQSGLGNTSCCLDDALALLSCQEVIYAENGWVHMQDVQARVVQVHRHDSLQMHLTLIPASSHVATRVFLHTNIQISTVKRCPTPQHAECYRWLNTAKGCGHQYEGRNRCTRHSEYILRLSKGILLTCHYTLSQNFCIVVT